MKIKRTVEGKEMEFSLTSEELRQAVEEGNVAYRMEDIKNKLQEDYPDIPIEAYDKDEIYNAAIEVEEYIGNDWTWTDAVDQAIEDYIEIPDKENTLC